MRKRFDTIVLLARLTSLLGLFAPQRNACAAESTGIFAEMLAPRAAGPGQKSQASHPSPEIEGFSFEAKRWEVQTEDTPSGPETFVTLRGVFQHEDWTLIGGPDRKDSKSLPSSGRAFQARVVFKAPKATRRFVAVGPFGNIQETIVSLEVKAAEWVNLGKKRTSPPVQPPELSFGSGLGVSSNSYSQPGFSAYSGLALTLKGLANYRLGASSRWDLGLSGYWTALPLSSPISGTSIRFLGVNVRAGYSPFFPEVSPWSFKIMAGYYYATMMVSGSREGYHNISGPEIYPTIQRTFSSGDQAQAYFKYSPVSTGFTLLSLSNRELALGLAYTRPLWRREQSGASSYGSSDSSRLTSRSQWGVSLDVSDLILQIPTGQVESRSLTLGFQYGW